MEGKKKQESFGEVVQALIQATDGKFRDWPRDKQVAIIRRAMDLLEDETVWKSV